MNKYTHTHTHTYIYIYIWLPWWLICEETACQCQSLWHPQCQGDADTIPGSGRSLEKEMTTAFSFLAWEIPWTEEPGGLQSWC